MKLTVEVDHSRRSAGTRRDAGRCRGDLSMSESVLDAEEPVELSWSRHRGTKIAMDLDPCDGLWTLWG